MKDKTLFILMITGCLFFNVSDIFAQCGLPGTPPCPITKASPTVKKTAPKPSVPKPSILVTRKPQITASKPKPQTAFIPHAPQIEMVRIPAGSFMMGSNIGNEKPIHRVNIGYDFYIGKYEITQAQWQTVMGNNPSNFSKCGDTCPVDTIGWDDAQGFIRKLNSLQSDYNYRLPSEAEWEYAARAGTSGDYYGDLNSIAWYDANSGNKTHPVGQKQSNSFGLYDMSGNVSEWVEDRYSYVYHGLPTDGSANINLGGTAMLVMRGCSWRWGSDSCRSSARQGFFGSAIDSFGFRVVAGVR